MKKLNEAKSLKELQKLGLVSETKQLTHGVGWSYLVLRPDYQLGGFLFRSLGCSEQELSKLEVQKMLFPHLFILEPEAFSGEIYRAIGTNAFKRAKEFLLKTPVLHDSQYCCIASNWDWECDNDGGCWITFDCFVSAAEADKVVRRYELG